MAEREEDSKKIPSVDQTHFDINDEFDWSSIWSWTDFQFQSETQM